MRGNYGEREFYTVASQLDQGRVSLDEVETKLDELLSVLFNQDGSLRSNDFHNYLYRLFDSGRGYYGWAGLRYFLYEYELSLSPRAKKVEWEDLLKSGKDRITIEHIYPQTETPEWAVAFNDIEPERRPHYGGSLGNLLLLSGSVNSSLQNVSFANKKTARYVGDRIVRDGYSNGSHSEIEIVERWKNWGPDEIRERGLKLLRFMEERWNFTFQSDDIKERLLFLWPEDEDDLQS